MNTFVDALPLIPLLETAYIEFDPAATDVQALVAAVERAGFGTADIRTRRG